MNYLDLQKEYGGEYIATIKEEIIAHGRTFKDVLEKVRSIGKIEEVELSFRFIQPKVGICVY